MSAGAEAVPYPLRRAATAAVLLAALTLPVAAGASGQAPANDASADRPEGTRESLRALLARLESQDQARRKRFEAAAGRGLPAKAAERLARTRQAYEDGQGRLIRLLRAALDPAGTGAATDRAPREQSLAEAMALLERIEAAGRNEPISAAELKIKAPALTAPPPSASAASAPAKFEAPADLDAASIGPVPDVLAQAAVSFAGPVEIYEWVRNTIRPELYHGAMKGPVQAFLERSGNDADTAGILVEMLRAKGIPARYVTATVQVPAATLTAVIGTTTVEQAVRALERAGIPHQVVLGGAGVSAVSLERVFVEAYVPYANYRGTLSDAHGKAWIPLDPHWKRLEPVRGLDVVQDLGFDARGLFDAYLTQVQSTTPLEQARARVTDLLAEQRPGVFYADAINGRTPLMEFLGLLPSSLPYTLLARHGVGFTLDETLRHSLRVVGETADGPILDVTVPLADVMSQRLTIAYVPFDDDDRTVVEQYGGLTATPPYLVDVRPVLKSGGVAIASGSGAVGMAVRYTLRLELVAPGGTTAISNRVLAGNLLAIGLAGAHSAAPPTEGETAAQILDSLAQTYLRRWNEADEELANLLRVVPVRPIASACLLSSDVQVDYAGGDPAYPLDFVWKGILIDADLRASAPVALSPSAAPGGDRAARDFLLLSGLMGAALEQRIFENGLLIPAVSTPVALGLAPAQGVAVLDVTRDNVQDVLPGLALDPLVKAEIEEAALRGLLVRVPAGPVTKMAWTGVGYVLLDEETGEAAYQLQGGHSGGVTAPSVVEIPAEIRDPLVAQGEPISPQGTPVAKLERFPSTDFQAGTVNQPLQRAFKVLATDADGHPIARAPVTFRVIGGGGLLQDPLTVEPLRELTVLSDSRGEASVTLILGNSTDDVPRFVQLEGDEFATQVGLNLVTAFSGETSLPEPFLSWGYPDDMFDGVNRHATLTNRSPDVDPFVAANLTVGGLANIDVADPYGNPLSNIPVRFAYEPPNEQWEPCFEPGACVHLRDPTSTPGHVLKPADYSACAASALRVLYGKCTGEAEAVVVNSSSVGAFAYPLLGDSSGSFYAYRVTSEADEAANIPLKYGTWAFVCHAPSREACGEYGRQPWEAVNHGSRGRSTNRQGNMVEAYATGGTGDITLFSDAVYEDAQLILPAETLPDGTLRYRVKGINTYRRVYLTNSEFSLSPTTPGTTVAPAVAAYAGQGSYSAVLTMAAAPQLNNVRIQGKHFPDVIHYLPQSPEYVAPVSLGPGPSAKRVPDAANPWQGTFDFGLWGVQPRLIAATPSALLLTPASTVEQTTAVTYEILPGQYSALLDPNNIRFQLRRGDDAPFTASGDNASFTIPAGLRLLPATYNGVLTILFTSPGQNIDSAPLPLLASMCPVMDAVATPAPFDVNQFGWSLHATVTPRDGLKLEQISLQDRFMATAISLPYVEIGTQQLAFGSPPTIGARCELRPGAENACDLASPKARSRLVAFAGPPATITGDGFVIEATYLLDRLDGDPADPGTPNAPEACLLVKQRYEFYREKAGYTESGEVAPDADPCEVSGTLACARYKPIVEYRYGTTADPLRFVSTVQRLHLKPSLPPPSLAPATTNGFVFLHDCELNPYDLDCFVTPPVHVVSAYDRENPLSRETLIQDVIKDGRSNPVLDHLGILRTMDNMHQSVLPVVDEPVINPGCPDCAHMHWRWTSFASPGTGVHPRFDYNGGRAILPSGSKQDVTLAMVRYHPGEEHPTAFQSLANGESTLPTQGGAPVLWYNAKSRSRRDQFFGHGGFFNSRGGRPLVTNLRAVHILSDAFLVRFTARRVQNHEAIWEARVDGQPGRIASGRLAKRLLPEWRSDLIDDVTFPYLASGSATIRILIMDTATGSATEATTHVP